jgi:membrane protease YdiL (CAAX protease family)
LTNDAAVGKPHRAAPWLALALLVLMGSELVAAVVAHWFGIRGDADFTPQSLVAVLAARDAAALCLALFGVYAILRAPLASIGLRLPKASGVVMGIAFGLVMALIFPRVIQELHLQRSYRLEYDTYVMSRSTGVIAAASILVSVFVAPVVEEIVFRGIVLGGLVEVTNDVVAILVSAGIFAGIHAGGGASQMTTAFLTGIVFGWLYLRTRSIVPSSLAHVIYNAAAFYPVILLMLRARAS